MKKFTLKKSINKKNKNILNIKKIGNKIILNVE